MTRAKLGAGMLAFALIAACGGGSNNADNSSANNENNANNQSNTPNNENNTGSAFNWSATMTGLDDADFDPPAGGFAGDGVSKAGAKLLGGSLTEPQQNIAITADSGDVYDEIGESEVSLLISWGDPRVECISNLADTLSNTGATMNITELGPASGTFEGNLDCYLVGDQANSIQTEVTGSFDIVGL